MTPLTRTGRTPDRRGLLADSGGATAVEFAIVALLFILFLGGTIEFSRMLWVRHTLQLVAVETARFASLRGATIDAAPARASIQSFAAAKAEQLAQSRLTVNVTVDAAAAPDRSVTIQVTYSYDALFGNLFLLANRQLQSRSAALVINS